jgi:hypothetical protein
MAAPQGHIFTFLDDLPGIAIIALYKSFAITKVSGAISLISHNEPEQLCASCY